VREARKEAVSSQLSALSNNQNPVDESCDSMAEEDPKEIRPY